MKKIFGILIIILCLALITSQASASQWVYIGGGVKQIKKLPDKWTFTNGTKTGNFKQMPMVVKLVNGWRPITVVNNGSYDSALEKRTLDIANIVIFSNHAEITYTISPRIGLLAYKKERANQIKLEGMAILDASHVTDWGVEYAADRIILRDYWRNTIKSLIMNGTLESIRDLKNGFGYNWPTLLP